MISKELPFYKIIQKGLPRVSVCGSPCFFVPHQGGKGRDIVFAVIRISALSEFHFQTAELTAVCLLGGIPASFLHF